ncbi:MAG: hypothetical protein AMXMBFR33_72450 [Candidatus Xenobia bacterium]
MTTDKLGRLPAGSLRGARSHLAASFNEVDGPLTTPARVWLTRHAWSSYNFGVKQVNVYEAKTHLSRLLQEALAGEEVVIARDGVPLVRLVPVADSEPRPLLGLMKEIWIADDFDAPLDDFADYR